LISDRSYKNLLSLENQDLRGCPRSRKGDNIKPKAELIRAARNWPILAMGEDDEAPECLIRFSKNEEERCIRIEAVQDFIDVQMEKIRDRIGIITDGRTPPMTCEDTLKQNWHVKNEAFEREDDGTRKENIQNRPFDDHEG
jgi:hypothetical protein